MNAKETLQKIAEALNIVSSDPVKEPVVEEQVEAQPEQPVEEQPVADQNEVVEEKTEEPVAEESNEQPVEESVEEQPKDDPRVAELQKQLDDLKEILKQAMAQPVEPVEQPQPAKVEEPKGLTHSPEKQVKTKAKGVGNKGNDIMSRVFKYMNNN